MSSPDIVIRIDRKGAILLAALIIVCSFSRRLWSESLTLLTTYPAPSGIYQKLVTNRLIVKGQFSLEDGGTNPARKVLVSDKDGNATWGYATYAD